MSYLDYLKPVRRMSSDAVRRLLDERGAENVNLVDVRQPREYERGHIPGARLIPLAELQERLGELDPDKPTVAY